MRSGLRSCAAVTVVVLAVAFLMSGCGGGNGGGGGGIIVVEDYLVADGETKRYNRDTIIQAANTARVEGRVVGAAGVSITIEAGGDITVTGSIAAGDGAAGAADGAGGDGGDVVLRSTAGNITVGEAAVGTAQAGDSPALQAGDGGVGGDGLVGGTGGEGGSVELTCATGELTLHPRSSLIHIGSGGDGGTGYVPETYAGDFSALGDRTPDGGDAGVLTSTANELVGVAKANGAVPLAPADLLAGGDGGDGGARWVSVPVGTDILPTARDARVATTTTHTHRQASAAVKPAQVLIRVSSGGCGGDSSFPGQPGSGGEMWMHATPDRNAGLEATGGKGGDLRFDTHWDPVGERPYSYISSDPTMVYRGGSGGRGAAIGVKWSSSAAPGVDGAEGLGAGARGGEGGSVRESELDAEALPRMIIQGGPGGPGTAQAGSGQDGGDYCGYIGGDGGAAGPHAGARGGAGGDQVVGRGGDGGDAWARGGDGGNGGAGNTPGAGGAATAEVTATAGESGAGASPGQPGQTRTIDGQAGEDGQVCSGGETGYTIVTSDSETERIYGYPNWFTSGVGTSQVAPGFTLGGDTHPVLPPLGHSMVFCPSGARLWVANELGSIALYRNPTTGGDRAPDTEFRVTGAAWRAIWFEPDRDIVYATSQVAGVIYAWDGASSLANNTPPTRTIGVPGTIGGSNPTGAPGSDRLFAPAQVNGVKKIVVYDQAHLANGATAPDRVIETGNIDLFACAWDNQHDLLFVGAPGGKVVNVYTQASTLQGTATPARTLTVSFSGMEATDTISALIVAPADDLLFVSMFSGQMLVYRSASTISGTPTPDMRGQTAGGLGLGVLRS